MLLHLYLRYGYICDDDGVPESGALLRHLSFSAYNFFLSFVGTTKKKNNRQCLRSLVTITAIFFAIVGGANSTSLNCLLNTLLLIHNLCMRA